MRGGTHRLSVMKDSGRQPEDGCQVCPDSLLDLRPAHFQPIPVMPFRNIMKFPPSVEPFVSCVGRSQLG